METREAIPSGRSTVQEVMTWLSEVTGVNTEDVLDSSVYLRGTLQHLGETAEMYVNVEMWPVIAIFVFESGNDDAAYLGAFWVDRRGGIVFGRQSYTAYPEITKLTRRKDQ